MDEMHKKITELIFILTKCNRCFKMILQNNENDISKKEMIYQKQKEDTPMKKKLVLALLVSAMAANLLAGCGGSGSGSDDKGGGSSDDGSSSDDKGGGESDSGDKTVLTVTWRDEGKGESSPLYKWFAEAYETYEDKDEIELDYQYITASEGDYFAKVALSLQDASTAPDIVCEDTFYVPSDVAAGNLTNLDEYLSTWDDWSNFYDNTKEAASMDGSVYGIPYSGDTRGIIYNKEVFEQAGLPADWAPADWQDILDACKQIKEKCPDVIPFWCNSGQVSGEATSMQTYEELLYGTGEEVYEDGKFVVSSQAIMDTLTFIETLYKEGYATEDLIYDTESSDNVVQNYLPKGEVAMMLNGNWVFSNYTENGSATWEGYEDKIGFVCMPTQDGSGQGHVTMSGGWALAIPELSDEKDAAWGFITHLMNYDNYKKCVTYTGNLSTRSDMAEDEDYAATPFMTEATQFLEYAKYRPHTDEYTNVSTYIQAMVESVAAQTATPEQAMEKYKTDVTNAVGEDKVIEK